MNRNFGLDLARAISIWLVLLQHGGINIPGLQPLKLGGIGVEIFFVLSGFLIGGILFKEIDKGNSFSTTLKSFWIRRWYRILPLYYAVLLFKFFIIDSSVGWNILYYFSFTQNNFYGVSFLGPSWSLVIEEWFYIICPIYIIIAKKVFKTNTGLFLALVLFIFGVNLLRFGYVYYLNVPYMGVNSNVPFRLDSLFLGVVLAFFKHGRFPIYKTMQSPLIFITGCLAFLSYLYYYWTLAYPGDLIDSLLIPRTIGFVILPLTISLMIPYIASFEKLKIKGVVTTAFYFAITWTSLLTYAIYLIHALVYPFVFSTPLLGDSSFKLVLAILVTYFLAALVYHYFEHPILKYRDKKTLRKDEVVKKEPVSV